jgi:methionine-rich copper-binding protein CopC
MKRMLISLISLAVLLVPVNANAHAGVVGTSPTQDQVLTSMPKEIAVTFSEELLTIANQEINTLSLNAFDGPPVELGEIKISGTTLSATIPAGEYASGVYEVTYRIVSADGHKVSDSFTFSLNVPALISEPVIDSGDGVIPAPIAMAIAIVVILGGYLALRASKRKS